MQCPLMHTSVVCETCPDGECATPGMMLPSFSLRDLAPTPIKADPADGDMMLEMHADGLISDAELDAFYDLLEKSDG